MKRIIISGAIALCSLSIFSPCARGVNIRVTFENLTPNSVFSPLSSIFHDGSFANFDLGSSAPVEIQWIAELGNASFLNTKAINQGFAAKAIGGGPILGGNTVSEIFFNLDSTQNRYFNFASMFIPSNDAFIGNDNPLAYQIFEDNGNFIAQTINISANEIWDAGTEVNDETSPNAVIPNFPVTPNLNGGIAEDEVVRVHPGYENGGNFESLGFISPDELNSPVARITISTVSTPEPGNLIGLLAVGSLGLIRNHKRR